MGLKKYLLIYPPPEVKGQDVVHRLHCTVKEPYHLVPCVVDTVDDSVHKKRMLLFHHVLTYYLVLTLPHHYFTSSAHFLGVNGRTIHL